ncbi:MAG TPA: hypothetical protein VNJ01_04380 [Bacteriovoracaceae bacterium]|nr:hypothetical protein [Bacteriovoracaceae bacterium]
MRRLFFLPTTITYGLFALLFYSVLKHTIYVQLAVVLVFILVGFVFRRSSVPHRESSKLGGEIYLSPVHGRVESIRQMIVTPEYPSPCHEVRISMSLIDEKGLYLPTAGEVTYLKATKGKKIPRNAKEESFYTSVEEISHTDLKLTSKSKITYLLRFIDSTYSERPVVYLKYGDRGVGAACFGYYPFGGTLIIYLPQNSDILVFDKEKVIPGLTVIAAVKDKKKEEYVT